MTGQIRFVSWPTLCGQLRFRLTGQDAGSIISATGNETGTRLRGGDRQIPMSWQTLDVMFFTHAFLDTLHTLLDSLGSTSNDQCHPRVGFQIVCWTLWPSP